MMNEAEIVEALKDLPDWRYDNDTLVASFRFKSFMNAMAFMSGCALYCDKHNHHPQWTNTYRTIDISLTTHDAGGKVTHKDVDLAKHMSEVFGG